MIPSFTTLPVKSEVLHGRHDEEDAHRRRSDQDDLHGTVDQPCRAPRLNDVIDEQRDRRTDVQHTHNPENRTTGP